MPGITTEAQGLIAKNALGNPINVYKPSTVASIIGAIVLLAFATFWIVLTASLTNSPLLPFLPFSFSFPSMFNGFGSSAETILSIVGIVFPAFGLIFMVIGLAIIISALRNRNARIISCTNGIALVTREQTDAFRWEHILTTFNRIDENTTRDSDGHLRTTRSYRLSVHLHDGRKFVFDDRLFGKGVQDLAETIAVQQARSQQRRNP